MIGFFIYLFPDILYKGQCTSICKKRFEIIMFVLGHSENIYDVLYIKTLQKDLVLIIFKVNVRLM